MTALWVFLNYFVFIYPLYMSFIWIVGALIFFFHWEWKPIDQKIDIYPFFSIVIPAHNEEGAIKETVNNLKDLNYPIYEVIVVNDGSTDRTAEILDQMVSEDSEHLRVIHLSPNGGKSRALNMGSLFSRGELLLFIDADCLLDKNALKYFAWHFVNFPRVGAVTGNPRIRNRTTLLGKIQVGEYSSIIGLIKRAQRVLGKVFTVSGVINAFRKGAFCTCGFFDSDTVTEDIDMTWKLEKQFWDVRFETRAIGWILTPETLSGLWAQRVRWAQGAMQVARKHVVDILHFKQLQFWPVYIEYVISIIWGCSLGLLFFSWLIGYILYFFGIIGKPIQPFIPPAWAGSILALMCIVQFMVSLYIDSHYEHKSFLKNYFWVIWYPFFYWAVIASTVFVSLFNVFIRKGGVSVRWKSPDRGLQTLK